MAADAAAQDLERLWDEIREGFAAAYSLRQMSTETFMTLYTHVYRFCSAARGAGDGQQRDEAAPRRVRDENERRNRSQMLYMRIRQLLRTRLEALVQGAEDKNGEDLITFYLEQWEQFTFGTKVVNGICSYLNRYWINDQRNEGLGDSNVCEVYPLGMRIWSEVVFEALRTPMTAFILQNILRDRQGELVDSTMIKRMTNAISSLGESCRDLSSFQVPIAPIPIPLDNGLGIYRASFEDPFISATESFYVQEAAAFLQSEEGSVQEYMRRVEQGLSEEVNRAGSYLHSCTLFRLMESCERVLILRNLPIFIEEFPKLLKANEMEALARMYSLVARIPNAFGGMEEQFQQYIEVTGRTTLEENLEQVKKSPMAYVKTLLNVYQNFHGIVIGPFRKDPGFVAALDQGCRSFVNRNCLTSDPSDPNRARKSPIALARYYDLLLRKTGKVNSEQELEDILNQAIIIFKYIDDKDVFKHYYTSMLAKRLVDELSASDDSETQMISKLKTECGSEYTVRLHKMFQDICLSRDLNAEFREFLKVQGTSLQLSFTTKVLQAGSWPYNPDPRNDSFILPQVLESCVSHYTTFYGQKTQGRKLTWLHKKSTGEVESDPAVFDGTSYTFMLPTYGLAILLQYSSKDSSTLQELADATQLNQQTVTSLVLMLLKADLLNCAEGTDELSATSNIRLNLSYKSKKRKVNLTTPIAADVKMDDERNQASVDKERTAAVKAAIVRVMKMRKVLNLQSLISEVVDQLKSRFSPSIPLIKKCVADLITDEYLKRNDEEPPQLVYIS